MSRRPTAIAVGLAPPLVFGVILLGAWEAVVRGLDLKPYFLVPPTSIGARFYDNWSNIWEAMIVTGTNAAFGLFFGTIAGVLTAFLLSRSKILDQLVTPMSVAVNAIPAFVLVSVFNNMFSTTSVVPRRLMVSLVVFFIVLVNVATGLRQVDPTHTELMQVVRGEQLGDHAQGARAECRAVPVQRLEGRRAAVGHLRLCFGVLWWCAERFG